MNPLSGSPLNSRETGGKNELLRPNRDAWTVFIFSFFMFVVLKMPLPPPSSCGGADANRIDNTAGEIQAIELAVQNVVQLYMGP